MQWLDVMFIRYQHDRCQLLYIDGLVTSCIAANRHDRWCHLYSIILRHDSFEYLSAEHQMSGISDAAMLCYYRMKRSWRWLHNDSLWPFVLTIAKRRYRWPNATVAQVYHNSYWNHNVNSSAFRQTTGEIELAHENWRHAILYYVHVRICVELLTTRVVTNITFPLVTLPYVNTPMKSHTRMGVKHRAYMTDQNNYT